MASRVATYGSITRSNWTAAGAHGIAFAILLVLYLTSKSAKKLSTVVTYRYDISGPSDTVCTTGSGATPSKCQTDAGFTLPKKNGYFNVILGCIAFFAFTSLAHVFYATDAMGSGKYSTAIANGHNPYRWGEYAVSASLMTIIICLVNGVRDTTSIFLMASITAAMQLCGAAVEENLKGAQIVNKGSVATSTATGWLLFVALWGVFLETFFRVIRTVDIKYHNIKGTDGKPIAIPSWVWFIVLGQLFSYALFGLVQRSHIAGRISQGPSYNFATTEAAYIKLSFFAKLALAGGIGYGLIGRTQGCN